VADETSKDYNAPQKATQFLNHINNMRKYYRSDQLLITMGEDFSFRNAKNYFERSDSFIKYFNEHTGKDNNIKLIYSTPSMYIDAVNKANVKWPTRYNDMFPYGSDYSSYWTGFFSSRPLDKAIIRKGSQLFLSAA
jgi:lysosomal alpha-mannosidase